MVTIQVRLKGKNFPLNGLFYGIIGVNAALALFLIYDFFLNKTSSITTLILNTKTTPFYLWFYIISTFLALILFGMDVAISVYLFRRTKLVKGKEQSGTVVGTIVGAFAASCPVCSGFLLALVGISGGLSAFPFKGLELKTLSVLFLAFPFIYFVRRLKNPNCDGSCPTPKNANFTKKDYPLLLSFIVLFVAELFLGYSLLTKEPIVQNLFFLVYLGSTPYQII